MSSHSSCIFKYKSHERYFLDSQVLKKISTYKKIYKYILIVTSNNYSINFLLLNYHLIF